MKKRQRIPFAIVLFILFIFLISFSSACNLDAKIINQDPYPAIPGEEVKVVFQLDGTGDPSCGKISFELLEKFPFRLETGSESIVTVNGGSVKNFKSFLIIPYILIVNPDAVDGNNDIEVRYISSAGEKSEFSELERFNISVEDVRTDFEISIKDYEAITNIITFEILNVGEHDVEALTIEIPKQDNIAIKGSKRNIIGSLDANEDTTFTFEAIPSDGEIKLTVIYTDEINERRILEKSIIFDSDYYKGRARDNKGTSPFVWIAVVIVIVIIFFWWRSRSKKIKMKRSQMK